jgi:hypothetical protein
MCHGCIDALMDWWLDLAVGMGDVDPVSVATGKKGKKNG